MQIVNTPRTLVILSHRPASALRSGVPRTYSSISMRVSEHGLPPRSLPRFCFRSLVRYILPLIPAAGTLDGSASICTNPSYPPR